MTMFPNKATIPASRANKQIGLLWLNIALAILLAVMILSLPGADEIHIVGGLLLMIGCGVHLVLHRRWIKAVILETPQNVTPALHRQRRLFWGMFLSGSLCGLSGLAMLPLVLDFHAFLPLHCCGTPIHILSGLTFLGLNIYHLVLHRNWFAARLGWASVR
jgi:hypothetical protein